MNSKKIGKCPTCDHTISITSLFCPNCGETNLHETVLLKNPEDELGLKSLATGNMITDEISQMEKLVIINHVHQRYSGLFD